MKPKFIFGLPFIIFGLFIFSYQNCVQQHFDLRQAPNMVPASSQAPTPQLTEVVYPPDAGVINVQTLYGAKGDGVTDDTLAIQKAISDHVGQYGFGIIYFPTGTYLVSQKLSYLDKNGNWGAFLTLQGENQQNTVIKLADHAANFQDSKTPQAVIFTASNTGNHRPQSPNYNPDGSGNEGFSNNILNLTINTGTGNPGAIGIDYMANNSTQINSVSVISGDGAGVVGISMQRGTPGPLLIKNVSVTGFNSALIIGSVSGIAYGVWLEHLQISGQLVSGIDINQGVISIRDLQSDESVPAIRAPPPNLTSVGLDISLSVVDSSFSNGSQAQSAVILGPSAQGSQPIAFLRNIVTSGYQAVVGQGGSLVAGVSQSEWSSLPALGFVAAANSKSLDLSVQETPTFNDNNFSDWANVVSFGAKPSTLVGGPQVDSTQGIQAAIDSGRPVIYCPPGNYFISDTIHIRGAVQKFMGLNAFFLPLNANFPANDPAFAVDQNQPSQVFVDGLNLSSNFWGPNNSVINFPMQFNFLNASSSTVILTNSTYTGYQNVMQASGQGSQVFLENVFSGAPYQFYNQQVFARNLDPENWGPDPHVIVRGGSLWTLGLKIEGTDSPIIQVDSGAQAEILGLSPCTFSDVPTSIPMAINLESALSISSYMTNSFLEPPAPGLQNSQPTDYAVTLSETLGGVNHTLYGATSLSNPSASHLFSDGSYFPLFSDQPASATSNTPFATCSFSASPTSWAAVEVNATSSQPVSSAAFYFSQLDKPIWFTAAFGGSSNPTSTFTINAPAGAPLGQIQTMALRTATGAMVCESIAQ